LLQGAIIVNQNYRYATLNVVISSNSPGGHAEKQEVASQSHSLTTTGETFNEIARAPPHSYLHFQNDQVLLKEKPKLTDGIHGERPEDLEVRLQGELCESGNVSVDNVSLSI
jgi:hypothetical protein